jgi:hypothetical protein
MNTGYIYVHMYWLSSAYACSLQFFSDAADSCETDSSPDALCSHQKNGGRESLAA